MKSPVLLLRLSVIAACVGGAGWSAALAAEARGPEDRPNVVFILADDLGWRDLACYGNTLVNTPRIDSLARDGMRFTQAYAYPTCSPTRVSLMTGDYPSRHGMSLHLNPHRRGWEKLSPPASPCGLTPVATSLADVVASRGYTSTLIGKWHLGFGNNPFNWERVEMPPQLGPNTPRVAFGFTRPPDAKADGIGAAYESRLQAFAVDNPGKSLGTQTLQAVRFIEQNRAQPFFCYLAFSTVHVPLAVRPELATRLHERVVARNALPDPRYLGMIEAMDESVGLILDALDELKLSENTIVIFASDNGGLIQDYYGAGPIITDMHPLRGQKSTLWEAGLRVPWIVRWPKVTKPGSTSSEPILCTDFFPTLADITGARLPENYSRDGLSLMPLLRRPAMKLPHRELYWHLPAYLHVQSSPSSAVRDGDHKLIEFLQDGHVELYNLAADPGEDRDLAAEEPARAAKLRRKLHAWRAAVGAEMPTPNPNYDPEKAAIWTVRPKRSWDPAPLEPRKDLPSRYFTPSAVE